MPSGVLSHSLQAGLHALLLVKNLQLWKLGRQDSGTYGLFLACTLDRLFLVNSIGFGQVGR